MAVNVEIVGEASSDTSNLGNGIEEIKRRIILQSFDSGVYTLKPILYVGPLGDTIASDRPVLKVIPANVDSLTTIHDYADAQDGERHFFDFLPDFMSTWWFWLIVAVVLIAAGIILYFHYAKKAKSASSCASPKNRPMTAPSAPSTLCVHSTCASRDGKKNFTHVSPTYSVCILTNASVSTPWR